MQDFAQVRNFEIKRMKNTTSLLARACAFVRHLVGCHGNAKQVKDEIVIIGPHHGNGTSVRRYPME